MLARASGFVPRTLAMQDYPGKPGYGARGIRTPDLLAASQTLSQLSYGPARGKLSASR